jgi:polycomb protein EED
MHPILGAGNTKGRMYFWDLQKLEEAPLTCRELNTNDKTKKDGPSASASARSGRQGNVASGKPATEHARKSVSGKSTAPAAATTAPIFESLPLETARRNLKALASGIGNPFKPIKAHKTHVTSKDPWTVRQVAFSPDGQWCVACGSSTDDTDGMIAVFSRWEDGIPEGS